MALSRFGLRVLGPCALVVLLVALTASAAQAEVGSRWWIVNNLGQLVQLNATVGLEAEGTTSLLTKVLGKSVEIACTAVTAIGAQLEGNGSISKGSKIQATGCITKVEGVEQAGCKPKTAGSALGTVTTNGVHGLIVLHKLEPSGVKDELVLVLPDSGETLVTMELGEKCAIGETLPVRGNLTFEDCEHEFLVHKVTHLWQMGPLDKIWVLNNTAEHAATLDGSWFVRLVGIHTGLKWSGEPA